MRYLFSIVLLALAVFIVIAVANEPDPLHPQRAVQGHPESTGTFDPSTVPCDCRGDVSPFGWHSPVAYPHTEHPHGTAPTPCTDQESCIAAATPLPCTTDAECQPDSVKACRHATCRPECGFCVFLSYPPCSLDTCTEPGHHTTCQSSADCINAPYYDVDCIEGKCLILPPVASGFYCAGPGDLRAIGD